MSEPPTIPTVEPMSRGDLVRALVAPMVLALVAGVAVVRFHVDHQSSWQGAGFGMFATHEYEPARRLHVIAGEGTDARRLNGRDLPWTDLVERALVTPGGPATSAIARRVRGQDPAPVTVVITGHDVVVDGDGFVIGWRVLAEVTVP